MMTPMKKFFTKKRIIWIAVLALIIGAIGWRIFSPKDASAGIQTDTVKRQDLQQTVLSTGQVVSDTNLNLSFQTGGIVRSVAVKEGDRVKAGRMLAMLDQGTAGASWTSAQGVLAQARANYDRVMRGSTSQQTDVAQKAVDATQVALDNAKKNLDQVTAQQNLLVKNAYSAWLNGGLAVLPGPSNLSISNPTVSGTFAGNPGQYQIRLFDSGTAGVWYQLTGLESAQGQVRSAAPIALGTLGLFIQFPTTVAITDTWTVDIPNAKSTSFVTNNNAYEAAKATRAQTVQTAQNTVDAAQAALSQARANLNLTMAPPAKADVDAAAAQVMSAQGQVLSAGAAYRNTILTAPADGTITAVNIKIGELASALQSVMGLQSVDKLHAEANVSEANVASLAVGQPVDFTFDALGPDTHVSGTLRVINPASTVVSGVVNYKVTANIDATAAIKPGMTANMTILVAKKDQILAVPSRAVIEHDHRQYVRVIDDAKKKTYHEAAVQTGLRADGGWVEIVSGLVEGQVIVSDIQG